MNFIAVLLAVTIIGGSPAQRDAVEDALNNPRLPSIPVDLTVTITETSPYRGYALSRLIALDDDLSPDGIYAVFMHEYGHIWDKQYLTQADRQYFSQWLLGDPGLWYRAPYGIRPQEEWARAFQEFMLDNNVCHPIVRSQVYRFLLWNGGYTQPPIGPRTCAYN